MTKYFFIAILGLLLAACSLGTSQPVPTAQIIIVTPTSASQAPPKSTSGTTQQETALPEAGGIYQRETAAMLNPQPAANTADFSYAGLTYKLDKKTAWFFGEIRNQSEQTQTDIEIRINLLDTKGELVASETGYFDSAYLYAGEASSFKVLFSDNNRPPPFDQVRVDVLSKAMEADARPVYIRTGLSINDVRVYKKPFFDIPIIEGTLTNTGKTTLRFPKVIITYYDARGAVIGVDSAYAETDETNVLLVQARAPFESTFTVLSGEMASYRLQAEALHIR